MEAEQSVQHGEKPQSRLRVGLVVVVVLGIAALVAIGSVVLIHGSSAQRKGDSAGPTAGTVITEQARSPFRTSAAIPGITAADIVDQLGARFNVRSQEMDGYYVGNVYDSSSGINLKVDVVIANQSGVLSAFGCYFVKAGIVVDAKLVDRAAQCVTLGIPQASRAEATSWLTAVGPKVANEVPVHRDIGNIRLIVVRKSDQYDNSVVPVPSTSASPSPR